MNSNAFLDKYTRLAPQLFRVALRIVGNEQDAEDAVQDTFIRVWEKHHQMDADFRVEAYFHTALRNVCLNQLRLRRESADIGEQVSVPDESDHTGQLREPDSLLHRIFHSLTPKSQRVMALRHVGEYSTRDIAHLTGESEANVRSILSRARKQMREAYLAAHPMSDSSHQKKGTTP